MRTDLITLILISVLLLIFVVYFSAPDQNLKVPLSGGRFFNAYHLVASPIVTEIVTFLGQLPYERHAKIGSLNPIMRNGKVDGQWLGWAPREVIENISTS